MGSDDVQDLRERITRLEVTIDAHRSASDERHQRILDKVGAVQSDLGRDVDALTERIGSLSSDVTSLRDRFMYGVLAVAVAAGGGSATVQAFTQAASNAAQVATPIAP